MNDLLELPDYVPPSLRRPLGTFSTERGRKVLWWVVGSLLALGFLAFLAVGANRPADPSLADAAPPGAATATAASGPQGNLRVTAADGTEQLHCVLVADSDDERAQGLMGRTELGTFDGMAFVFDRDTESPFHMKDTPMPLTVAWYAADGTFVSSADMEPCLGRPACPVYRPAGRYRLAVEVPKGQAAALGIGPGSRARLSGTCA